ncbi:MAG TPA: SigB/SigF/SigG family RNA polymerase sigma factor [Firmicutes bacterium]|nr:SigB/SigF/SigG family RNA polymerase sigma factor [Bacillota bacterium]
MTVLNSNEKNLCTPGGKTGLLSEEETLHLISLAHQGEQEAKESLLRYNLRLVRSIVVRFVGRGVEFDDLFQIGSLGLLKAIDRFKPEVGVKFSTYAVPLIMGEIKQYLRDSGTIKVSRNLKELSVKIRAVREKYLTVFGQEPTIADLQQETAFSRAEIAAALEVARPVSSLQEVVHEDEGSPITLGEQLGEEIEEKLTENLSLRDALLSLEPRLRFIVEERFFGEKTQAEIAAEMGLSQVQISRLEKAALQRLREFLRDESLK